MSEQYDYNNDNQEQLIDVPIDHNNDILQTVTVRYDKSAHKIRVRKRQLFVELSSLKLTYIKGGICDSFIKYGYPSLNEVIDNVQTSTNLEDQRLETLMSHLKKLRLKYDPRVSYYREYIEQGTDLKTAIKRGKREWFLFNRTNYSDILSTYRDEERAEEEAIERYLRKSGYTREFRKHIGKRHEFEMKIRLY